MPQPGSSASEGGKSTAPHSGRAETCTAPRLVRERAPEHHHAAVREPQEIKLHGRDDGCLLPRGKRGASRRIERQLWTLKGREGAAVMRAQV